MSQNLLRKLKVVQSSVLAGTVADFGICRLADIEWWSDEELVLDNIFSLWPDYSGSLSFPVPAPESSNFTRCTAFTWLLKWQGDYGELRKSLLNFCIEYLEESMK